MIKKITKSVKSLNVRTNYKRKNQSTSTKRYGMELKTIQIEEFFIKLIMMVSRENLSKVHDITLGRETHG